MSLEIERKYLLNPAILVHPNMKDVKPDVIIQAYLCKLIFEVRTRITNDIGTLCIKRGEGLVRTEHEYVIPLVDAEDTIAACDNMVQKNRYKIVVGSDVFEIDEYFGNNRGLVTMEIELRDENQVVKFPEWLAPFVTEEVTGNKKYSNFTLSYR